MSKFENMSDGEKRQYILNSITDAVSNLMYYDRKGSESSNPGDFEQAIFDGVISVEDMVEAFRESVEQAIGYQKVSP